MRPKVSGFTFVHNAIESGYVIQEALDAVQSYVDEMVVVDMQSTDGTRELLEKNSVHVLDGQWMPGHGGSCLEYNFAMHVRCAYDVVWHFEADEVYDNLLASEISDVIDSGCSDMCVHRLQVEQNFQRVRWYPELVHRIFRKGSVRKQGHTTDIHKQGWSIRIIPPECGFLWDVTGCFRDSVIPRQCKQAELWGGPPKYIFAALHMTHQYENLSYEELCIKLQEPHWTWTRSPLGLPYSLRKLVGKVRYEC